MKKNLFYLFAVICTMSLSVACSDDDDDEVVLSLWEQMSTLTPTATTATVDGTAVSGTAGLKLYNEAEGDLTLTNIVPGYATVVVDVELDPMGTTGFRFAGDEELMTAPATRDDDNYYMEVTVSGTVLLDGTLTVNVTTKEGPAMAIAKCYGTYAGETLLLTYDEKQLLGTRQVVFSEQNGVPVMTLANIVPGEMAASVAPVIVDKNGKFDATGTTAAGNTVEVKGGVANGVMTLDVEVELGAANRGGLEGDWKISKNLYGAQGLADNTAVEMTWTPTDAAQPNALQTAQAVNIMVSNLLCEVLDEVDFDDDGTLNADFNAAEKKIQGDLLTWIMGRMQLQTPTITVENTVWTDSDDRGANLVFWYVQNGMLYIKPNIENIIDTLAANGKISQENMATINAAMTAVASGDNDAIATLLTQLNQTPTIQAWGLDLTQFATPEMIGQVKEWLTNGVPLLYEVSGNNLYLYVNKAMCSPFMPIAFSVLATLQAQLTEKAQTEAAAGNMKPAETMQQFMQMLGLNSLTDLQTIWEQNTADFEIGINLTKDND